MKNAKYRLVIISTIPRIFLRVLSCILVSMQIATADTAMKVSRMGISLFHVMNFRMRKVMMAEVVSARSPDKVVASAYDGIRKGRRVIMNIPKPKPVVLWTKLAPTAKRNISIMFSNLFN